MPFKHSDDVAHGPSHSRRAIECAHREVAQRTRLRGEIAVDLSCGRLEIQPGPERALDQIAREVEHRDPIVLGLRFAQPSAEPLGRGPMVRVVNDQDGCGAVLSRDLDFAHHRRMHRVAVCPSNTLLASFSWGSCVKISTALPAASMPV